MVLQAKGNYHWLGSILKQAQLSHPPVFFCRIMFCFLSFRAIKFCRFCRVFSMFAGRLTMSLGIYKFYKLFWPVKDKKTSKYISENNIWRHNWIGIKPHFVFKRKNIKIFPAKFFGYDISYSNEYFCLSLCCTSTFFYGYDFPCFFQNYILLKLLTCYFVFEVNVI